MHYLLELFNLINFLCRDARITEIYGGVTDIQKLVVAEQLIKEYGFDH